MPLDTPSLKDGIKALLDGLSAETDNPENARQEFADGLGNLIETYVKSGTPKYTSGLVAGTNAVTGVFVGSIE